MLRFRARCSVKFCASKPQKTFTTCPMKPRHSLEGYRKELERTHRNTSCSRITLMCCILACRSTSFGLTLSQGVTLIATCCPGCNAPFGCGPKYLALNTAPSLPFPRYPTTSYPCSVSLGSCVLIPLSNRGGSNNCDP